MRRRPASKKAIAAAMRYLADSRRGVEEWAQGCGMTDDGRLICQCECGGDVRGVEQFGRLWTWCTKCTPVIEWPRR